MLLDALRRMQRKFERAQRSEAAVAQIAPSAAGDLSQLRVFKSTRIASVEFAQRSKRHVSDVEVQTHADGVGRNQVVDFPRLKHGYLRVARARRKRAEHHRRAATQHAQAV